MKKGRNKHKKANDELRPEYDLSQLRGRVQGKHASQYERGTNLVLLSPDVAAHFPDDESVNTALRSVLTRGKKAIRRTR
jgi:hypothetical protein